MLRIESFGQDCLGNITGYRVYEGYGANRVCRGQFCGDIYVPGSFDRAYREAEELLANLGG